jgi:hypothetical protein
MADISGVAVTGLTPTVTLSKNSGAFGAATNSPVEVSGGFYKVALTATETNTNGDFGFLATGTGAIPFRQIYQVETAPNNFDPATQTVDIGKVTGTAVTSVADFKADVSGVATSANLATVDTIVDAIKVVTDDLLSAVNLADTLIKRDLTAVTGSAPLRSLWAVLQRFVNKAELTETPDEMIVYEEDDITKSYEQDVTYDTSGGVQLQSGTRVAT